MTERMRIGPVGVAAAVVYANTLANGFVYDDGYYVLSNPRVTTASLTRLFQPMSSNNMFRPVTFASWALDWAIQGARPFGYHLVNVLLHAVVALLLYCLLRKLLEKDPRVTSVAFAAALLFAVHAIHTEAVAWISGRSELLAAGFLLAAWLLHLQDHPVPSLVCLVLAMLSKESAVVFLPLVVVGDYALGKFKSLARYAWISGVTVLYVALLWKIQGSHFEKAAYSALDNPLANLPLNLRILNALRVAWKYVGLQVYPATLSSDYSYNAIRLYADWKHVLPASLATAAIVALWVWAIWKKRSAWILAGAIYFLAFSVTSNILVATGTIMGERLAYLPSAGFCLLVALLWARVETFDKKVAYSALAGIVLLLAVRTVIRNRDWQNNLTLYSTAVAAVPQSARAHGLLGQEYLRRGELDAARAQLQAAVAIFPDYTEAIENYALAEARSGHDPEARRLLERALLLTSKSDADYDYRALNLAAWLVQHGENSDALNILNQVIADSPGESRAWANRAVLRYHSGELALARADAAQALQLDPGNAQAQNLLKELSNNATPLAR